MQTSRRFSYVLGCALTVLAMLLTPPALQAQSYRADVRTGLPVDASSKSTLTAPDCTTVPGNAFSNCSFETSDFTGWVTQDLTI